MHLKKLFDLQNKIAIVTGGYGLFGKSISLGLAEAGATVIIASRSLDKCRVYADDLIKSGLTADAFQFNQGEEKSIYEFVNRVIDKYNKIDILVNNSVTREGMADLDKLTKEGWEKAQEAPPTLLNISAAAAWRSILAPDSECTRFRSLARDTRCWPSTRPLIYSTSFAAMELDCRSRP
jgi:NAD(P)-dependent dehydrogenase (short-subunit alcohol dehydrogenase family)